MRAVVFDSSRPGVCIVNAAGTNAPKRSLEVLSLGRFQERRNAMIERTCTARITRQAFLPQMPNERASRS